MYGMEENNKISIFAFYDYNYYGMFHFILDNKRH